MDSEDALDVRDPRGKDRDRERDRDRDRDPKHRRANVRTTTGYSRIVGKRRLPNGAHQNPKYAVDPMHKMSAFSALADKFMSFMNGESDMVSGAWLCDLTQRLTL
jgi:hypothetical protein